MIEVIAGVTTDIGKLEVMSGLTRISISTDVGQMSLPYFRGLSTPLECNRRSNKETIETGLSWKSAQQLQS